MRAMEKIYTVRETASLFGVCEETVRRWLKEGRFADAVRAGGIAHKRGSSPWRIPENALKSFVRPGHAGGEAHLSFVARAVAEAAETERMRCAELSMPPIGLKMIEYTDDTWAEKFDRAYTLGFAAGWEAYRKAILLHRENVSKE